MLTSNAQRTSVVFLALLLAFIPLASAKDLRSGALTIRYRHGDEPKIRIEELPG